MMPLMNPLNRKGQNNLGTTEEQIGLQETTHLKNSLSVMPFPLFQFQAIDTFVSLCKCQIRKDKAVCISFFPNTVPHKSDAEKMK